MNTCAFLTTTGLDGFVIDDALAIQPLQDLGWAVRELNWRARADWNAFGAVVIRSTWDYMDDPDAFLDVLRAIDASDAVLVNDLDLVLWNLEKTYLRDLAARGVDVVPTRWAHEGVTLDLETAFKAFQADELVVKPVVGANAKDAFRVSRADLPGFAPILEETFAEREYLVQPFAAGILEEGEFSLFFFDGTFSHAILKRPEVNDFRAQEEHGATIESVDPEPRLLRSAARAVAVLPSPPLYARVDLVRHRAGFAVMELELVEPSLYLRMAPEAPERFARAFDAWMTRGGVTPTR